MRIPYPTLAQRGVSKVLRWQARITRKFLLPLGHDLCPERWIFVVGAYNSGTTLLAKILEAHPLIGALPGEGVYFTDSLPYDQQFEWERMWVPCLDKVRLNPESISPEIVCRIKKQWSLYYTKRTPNLLEKSAINVTRMPFLQAHFRPATIVAIVRNGYAVAEGIRRRGRPGRKNPEFHDSYPLELCAELWRKCDEIVSNDCVKLDRFKQIRYEDLTADPERVIKEITDFLGLPSLEPEVFHRPWLIRDINLPIQNMNSGSFERLTEAELDVIEQVAGHRLAKYGYERPR